MSFRLVRNVCLFNARQRCMASYANAKERKRFYKNVSVVESSSSSSSAATKSYEINLDKRKLKTPGGNLFQVDSELLAQMIANEWQSQTTNIKLNTMHFTSLANTCIDNPNKLDTGALVTNINDYLQTDTLIYFDSNAIEKLDNLQETYWRPIVNWFNEQFPDMNLVIRKSIEHDDDSLAKMINSPQHPVDSTFNRYLRKNFALNTLIAFNYIVECLKSVILTVALLERRLQSVDDCVRLSLLEQIHQYDQWGKVEWYHDINENEIKARVSAALLFIYLSNGSKYLVSRNVKHLNRPQ